MPTANLTKPHISTDEYLERRDAVLAAMRRENLDLLVITTPESILYLSGMRVGGAYSQQALILEPSGRHVYVARDIENQWLTAIDSWVQEYRTYLDWENPAEAFGRAAKDLRGGATSRLGVELNRRSLSPKTAAVLHELTDASELVAAEHVVESLRARKSTAEIELIRHVGSITKAGLVSAVDAIRGGSSDVEAVAEAFGVMLRSGSEMLCGGPSVSVGKETALAHAKHAGRIPQPGEIVAIMLGASVSRYQCPIERTYVLGEPEPETARMLDTVVSAAQAAMDGIRPGMTSAEADAIARGIFDEAGLGEHFRNRLGYSIGIAFAPIWWEDSFLKLSPDNPRVLEEGMTFHLVPALHVPGVGFLQRSHPIVITETGTEPLIDFPLDVAPI